MLLFQVILANILKTLEASYATQIARLELAISLCKQYNTGNWGGHRFLAQDIRNAIIGTDVFGSQLMMDLEQYNRSLRAELKQHPDFTQDTSTLVSQQTKLAALTLELNQLRKIWPI